MKRGMDEQLCAQKLYGWAWWKVPQERYYKGVSYYFDKPVYYGGEY